MANFKSKYDLGDRVYLVTDTEQEERIIVGVMFGPQGAEYDLRRGTSNYMAFELEITDERDDLKRLT